MPTPESMTATTAVRLAAKARGVVIVGLPNGELLPPGHQFDWFAGSKLKDGVLLTVIGPSNRRGWNAQVLALFGSLQYDKNEHAEGERFYRCKLVEKPQEVR